MLFQTGAGRHTYESTYDEYNLYMYYLSACKIIFYVAVGLIKVSITLFVRRLADRASKRWKIFSDIFLATVVIYILIAIFCKSLEVQNVCLYRIGLTRFRDCFLMQTSGNGVGQTICWISGRSASVCRQRVPKQIPQQHARCAGELSASFINVDAMLTLIPRVSFFCSRQ